MTTLDDLKAPYASAFHRLNEMIRHSFPLSHTPFMIPLTEAILQGKGKQLRPLLVFLSCEKDPDETCIQVAAAIELIHMASLIHDDIIDAADRRHQMPSITARFGPELAISSGVWLYAAALQWLVKANHMPIIGDISRTVDALCRGEMTQVIHRNRFDLSLLTYLRIIHHKTASLFGTAAWVGGYQTPYASRLRAFGQSLGVLYQLSDDLLDVVGDEAQLKKKGHQDFVLGETTLPIILALQAVDGPTRDRMLQLLDVKQADHMLEFLGMIKASSAVPETIRWIRYYQGRCIRMARTLPPDRAHRLCQLVSLVHGRIPAHFGG